MSTVLKLFNLRDNDLVRFFEDGTKLKITYELPHQAMTEAAFFTIGQSGTIGYGKIWSLADYRSRLSILDFHLIDLNNFLKVIQEDCNVILSGDCVN